MKKIILFAICILMMIPSMNVNAVKSYKKLYKKFLSQATVKAGKEQISTDWYYILNIDKKNKPELIIADVDSAYVAKYYVYTVSKNKVKYIGSCWTRGVSQTAPYLQYSSKNKGIIGGWWTNGIGGWGSVMFQIKNNKIKQTRYAYESDKSFNDATRVYEIKKSGNYVSEKKYNSYIKKYFNSSKTYQMKKNK